MLLAVTPTVPAQDCDGWIQRFPDVFPVQAREPLMVFDQQRGVSVLFTRTTVPMSHCETWEWDGEVWTLRVSDGGPCGDHGAMVYDERRGVTVYFGGSTKSGLTNATWEWDGVAWTERHPESAPSERERHNMAYDSGRGVTVLHGGEDDFDAFEETWEYNGENWIERVVNSPEVRLGRVMSYDAARGFVVQCGGTGQVTWEFDGNEWFFRGTLNGSRNYASIAFDAARGQVVRFGGDEGPLTYWNDTRAWDGKLWKSVQSDTLPKGRAQAAMAYDTRRGVMVLFGGRIFGGMILEDTWEFTCTPPCYADLDGSGVLDLFDYLGFVNLFNAADPTADCDDSESLDLFDFLCFTNAFNAGCP